MHATRTHTLTPLDMGLNVAWSQVAPTILHYGPIYNNGPFSLMHTQILYGLWTCKFKLDKGNEKTALQVYNIEQFFFTALLLLYLKIKK